MSDKQSADECLKELQDLKLWNKRLIIVAGVVFGVSLVYKLTTATPLSSISISSEWGYPWEIVKYEQENEHRIEVSGYNGGLSALQTSEGGPYVHRVWDFCISRGYKSVRINMYAPRRYQWGCAGDEPGYYRARQ
jgi:hypothetical protein